MWATFQCDSEQVRHIFPGPSIGKTSSKLISTLRNLHFLGVMWAIAQCEWELLTLTSSLASPSQVEMPKRRMESQLRPSPAWQRQRRTKCSCRCSVWSDQGWQGQHGGQMGPACAHSPGRKTEQLEECACQFTNTLLIIGTPRNLVPLRSRIPLPPKGTIGNITPSCMDQPLTSLAVLCLFCFMKDKKTEYACMI